MILIFTTGSCLNTLLLVQQLDFNHQGAIKTLHVILSEAYGALSGPEKLKIGVFDQEIMDGQQLIQSLKLYKMDVMLFMCNIGIAETIESNGDFHFQSQK